MGRKAHANYVEAALSVLEELGGGPISTKVLVAAAQERGLIGDGKWVYHNFSRKVRESDLFNTSVRGQISLAGEGTAEPQTPPVEDLTSQGFVDEPSGPIPDAAPEAVEEEPETVFPGPTLGVGFGGE